MATLIFTKNGEEIMRFPVRKQTVSVGRLATNDVCLPDREISRVHFLLEKQGDRWVLVDKSTNGTTVNGERILSRDIKDRDRIGVGKWEIVFEGDPQETLEILTTHGDIIPTQVLSYEPSSGTMQTKRAMLIVPRGDGKKIPISKSIFTLGKNPANDLVLKDEYVSNFHCRIELKGGEAYIKDLGSTNGTFVNNNKVVGMALPDGCTIRIGNSEFLFKYEQKSSKITPIEEFTFCGMVAKSRKMREIFAVVKKAAASDATVLITGESGTGKELIARALHDLSHRRNGRFVPINCGAISKDLVASELFGHERGAFTSANARRQGAFEYASGGTLFLDEIGEIPLETQATLLRVLESGEIKRVGGNEIIDVDVRLIAATNADLPRMVKEKKFRQDLFHRLYVIPINVPPLRERIEDIPLLVEHFLRGRKKGGAQVTVSDEAMDMLMDHTWEGNVRELRNVLERAVLSCDGPVIGKADIDFGPMGLVEETKFDYEDTKTAKYVAGTILQEVERERILRELKKYKWNKVKTAKALGIAKSTLHEKIKKYRLNEEE